MAVTNTGIVLRTITGVHDANFVHPIGDEEILNGGFDTASNWTLGVGHTVSGSKLNINGASFTYQSVQQTVSSGYRLSFSVSNYVSGTIRVYTGTGTASVRIDASSDGNFELDYIANGNTVYVQPMGGTFIGSIDNVSIKEVLVNRESTTTNTGIVERSIVGVHDANFVRPLGDEEIINGGFSNGSTDWNLGTGWSISGGTANALSAGSAVSITQNGVVEIGKTYKITYTISNYVEGGIYFRAGSGTNGNIRQENGTFTEIVTQSGNTTFYLTCYTGSTTLSIDNVSVKEVLVNRESTATNTGIVERNLTGVNESDLWLDSESTSVVNNTGIVERPITGVNVSDALFPDNTDSTVVNISEFIIPLLTNLEARATTFENRDATQNILINLQKC